MLRLISVQRNYRSLRTSVLAFIISPTTSLACPSNLLVYLHHTSDWFDINFLRRLLRWSRYSVILSASHLSPTFATSSTRHSRVLITSFNSLLNISSRRTTPDFYHLDWFKHFSPHHFSLFWITHHFPTFSWEDHVIDAHVQRATGCLSIPTPVSLPLPPTW